LRIGFSRHGWYRKPVRSDRLLCFSREPFQRFASGFRILLKLAAKLRGLAAGGLNDAVGKPDFLIEPCLDLLADLRRLLHDAGPCGLAPGVDAREPRGELAIDLRCLSFKGFASCIEQCAIAQLDAAQAATVVTFGLMQSRLIGRFDGFLRLCDGLAGQVEQVVQGGALQVAKGLAGGGARLRRDIVAGGAGCFVDRANNESRWLFVATFRGARRPAAYSHSRLILSSNCPICPIDSMDPRVVSASGSM